MPLSTESHPEIPSLVAELQTARAVDIRARANRLFARLVEFVDPVMRRIAGRFSREQTRNDLALRQNCLICLDDCVNRFTATLAAKVSFERYLGTRLKQHLAREYRRDVSPLSGFGLKLMRKVAAIVSLARQHDVDTSDPQAILDHAVSLGHRRTILRKYLPLTAGTLSLNAPGLLVFENPVIDFPAPHAELSSSETDIELGRRILARIPTLPDSQRRILTRIFGLDGRAPASLAEIARAEGVTAGSIAERRDRALARLRATRLTTGLARCAA